MSAKKIRPAADEIDRLSISDEMCAALLSFVDASGRLDSAPVLPSGVRGPDGVWASEVIRTVLDLAASELRTRGQAIEARRVTRRID